MALNLRPEVSVLAIDNKRDVYELLEMFDERAAIREYEGGQRRDLAEHLAVLDVRSYVERTR
jgi:hypothetical protein